LSIHIFNILINTEFSLKSKGNFLSFTYIRLSYQKFLKNWSLYFFHTLKSDQKGLFSSKTGIFRGILVVAVNFVCGMKEIPLYIEKDDIV